TSRARRPSPSSCSRPPSSSTAGSTSSPAGAAAMSRQDAPGWVRHFLLISAAGFVLLLLVVPAANVLYQSLMKGLGAYGSAIGNKDTLHAIFLTATVALISPAANTVFGVA